MKTEQPLVSGSFTLNHDQFQNIDRGITVPLIGGHLAIKVILEYNGIVFGDDEPSPQAQSIHYWVDVTKLPQNSKENNEDT